MLRILLLAIIIPIYAIYKIYKLIDSYRFDKIQEQYFVEKSEMQKAEYNKIKSRDERISIDRFNTNNELLYKVIPDYKKQDYIMDYSELQLYKELRKITDEKGWVIFPQVTLYSIVSVNDKKRFNKLFPQIKGKSIDFVICDEKNSCKIVMCIELEGSIRNMAFKDNNDKFKDKLFEEIGMAFVRIKRQENYNKEELIRQLELEDIEQDNEEEEVTYFSRAK